MIIPCCVDFNTRVSSPCAPIGSSISRRTVHIIAVAAPVALGTEGKESDAEGEQGD